MKIALCLCMLPLAAFAEDNCGKMLVQSIRIDGTIERIAPLTVGDAVIDVDEIDPRHVVRLRPIESAGKVRKPPPLRGRLLDIAVHSPARSGLERGRGEFQFQAMSCDGTFRRLIGFGPVPTVPTEFDGSLDEGGLYRLQVRFEHGFLRTLVELHPPMHHIAGIHWLNLDEFDALSSGTPSTIVIRVESRETEHRGGREWWTAWNARILRMEAGPAAQ